MAQYIADPVNLPDGMEAEMLLGVTTSLDYNSNKKPGETRVQFLNRKHREWLAGLYRSYKQSIAVAAAIAAADSEIPLS